MKLFKRKAVVDEAPRCPACGERAPEGAARCAMCGHAFESRLDDRLGTDAESAEADMPSAR